MAEPFNPYRDWLDISDGRRPTNHYAIFGLKPLESDPAQIHGAIDRLLARLRAIHPGNRALQWQEIMNEISVAKTCLTDPVAKASYDAQLRGMAGGARPSSPYAHMAPPPTAPVAAPPGAPPSKYPPPPTLSGKGPEKAAPPKMTVTPATPPGPAVAAPPGMSSTASTPAMPPTMKVTPPPTSAGRVATPPTAGPTVATPPTTKSSGYGRESHGERQMPWERTASKPAAAPPATPAPPSPHPQPAAAQDYPAPPSPDSAAPHYPAPTPGPFPGAPPQYPAPGYPPQPEAGYPPAYPGAPQPPAPAWGYPPGQPQQPPWGHPEQQAGYPPQAPAYGQGYPPGPVPGYPQPGYPPADPYGAPPPGYPGYGGVAPGGYGQAPGYPGAPAGYPPGEMPPPDAYGHPAPYGVPPYGVPPVPGGFPMPGAGMYPAPGMPGDLTAPTGVPTETFASPADMSRRRKRGSQGIGPALVLLVLAVAGLSVAVYFVLEKQKQQAAAPPEVAHQTDNDPVKPAAPPENAKPIKPSPATSGTEKQTPLPKLPTPNVAPQSLPTRPMDKPPEKPADKPPEKPADQPPVKPGEIDPAKQAALKKALGEAMAALSKRDISTAQTVLKGARANAQSPEEHDQLTRYENYADYVREFWKVMWERVSKFQAMEEVELGKTRIIIVEAGGGRFSIRAAGKTLKYQVESMPSWIATALAESLLNKDPQSQVIHGAFLAADPEGDREKAKQLWVEAARGGIKIDQLLPAIDTLPPVK